jgi:hypothetical protein
MKIEFEADYKDFAETAFHASNGKSFAQRLFPYLYSYALFAAISSIPVFLFSNKGLWAGILVFLLVFILSFYFYRLPTKSRFLNEYRKRLGTDLYVIEIEISEKGIKIRQLGNEYLFGWENLNSIEETDDRIFIYKENYTEVSVPKSAFKTPAEIGQFVAFTTSQLTPIESLTK